jgi:hypothetical protein
LLYKRHWEENEKANHRLRENISRDISGREQLSKICKEHLKLKSKAANKPIKNGQNKGLAEWLK